MSRFTKVITFVLVVACICNVAHTLNVHDDESNDILETSHQDTHALFVTKETGNTEDRDRLLAKLFQNYKKNNYPSNSSVQFGISVVRFDVDDLKNNLELDIWTRQQWNDSRLTWDPSEYGGHTMIRVPSDDVWVPDVVLYNSAADPDRLMCSKPNVILYSTGLVLFVPACKVKAYCNLTLDHEPFGEQACTLKYGSWTFDGYTMDLQIYGKQKADLSDLWDVTDWEITGNSATRVEKYYPCCKEPYPYIGFEFKFQRKGNTCASCSR